MPFIHYVCPAGLVVSGRPGPFIDSPFFYRIRSWPGGRRYEFAFEKCSNVQKESITKLSLALITEPSKEKRVNQKRWRCGKGYCAYLLSSWSGQSQNEFEIPHRKSRIFPSRLECSKREKKVKNEQPCNYRFKDKDLIWLASSPRRRLPYCVADPRIESSIIESSDKCPGSPQDLSHSSFCSILYRGMSTI